MAKARLPSLTLERAVARVRVDADDDLWPDPAGLIDLPRSAPEFAALRKRIRAMRSGSPPPALEMLVPKRDGLTRPAHVLLPEQRVYLQALVDSFMHQLDRRLEPTDRIYGYRTRRTRTAPRPFGKPTEQWKEWDKRVKASAALPTTGAAVITDVASFFERIPHNRLEQQLLGMGAPRTVVRELRTALRVLMSGADIGLPQGNDSSSVLATYYLDQVDKAVLRAGLDFTRYVDDMRLVAADEASARKALPFLEAAARRAGLNLQPGKTKVAVGRRDIRKEILDKDAEIEAVDYVYRRNRRRGMRGVRKAWRSVSRKKPWPQRYVKYLINRLRANGVDTGVGWCLGNLGNAAWLADSVAGYLALFISRPKVQRAIEDHLTSTSNIFSFEEVWLIRAFLSAKRVRRSFLDYLHRLVGDPSRQSPVREWAMVVLGRFGDGSDLHEIERNMLHSIYLARAALIGLQRLDPAARNTAYARVVKAYPVLSPLAQRIKARATDYWPEIERW